MECFHCKGRLMKGTAPFSVDRGGYHLHWDAVPARVCTQCGEPLFEGRDSRRESTVATEVGCHIITVTSDILKKLPLVGKNLEEFPLETVKMFHDDALRAGYNIAVEAAETVEELKP